MSYYLDEAKRLGIKHPDRIIEEGRLPPCIDGCLECRKWRNQIRAAQAAEMLALAGPLVPSIEDIDARFDPVTLTSDQLDDLDYLRAEFKRLARNVQRLAGKSQPTSVTLSTLQTASFWASRAIAVRNQKGN